MTCLQLLCQFACAVIEYDAELFNNIVLLLEVKDFHFLVFLTLGSTFPQVQKGKVFLGEREAVKGLLGRN